MLSQVVTLDNPETSEIINFMKESPVVDSLLYDLGKGFEQQHENVPDVPPLPDNNLPKKSKKTKETNAVSAASSKRSTTGSVKPYYHSLSRFPKIGKAEEIELFTRYYELKAQNPVNEREIVKLRNSIVERNLKFVIKVARGFWMDGNYQNFENLISCGNIGLIRAVDRFDLSQGVRFLTYAVNWIALEIRGELARNSLVIVPIWWQKIMSKINAAYKNIAVDENEHVPVELIAEKADVHVRHVRSLSNKQTYLSGRLLPSNATEVMFSDETPLRDTHTAEDSCVQANARDCVLKAIDKLKPHERLVIYNMYGFDPATGPHNLKRVSEIMGNTGERVRQLKVRGIASLRKKLSRPECLGGPGITRYSHIL